MTRLVAEALAYDEVLRDGGHYLCSGPLQSVETATTLRIESGKVTATDGPFTETKEHVGGFIVIEARDRAEAIQLASKIPPLRLGCIEIRPIRELESPESNSDKGNKDVRNLSEGCPRRRDPAGPVDNRLQPCRSILRR